MNHERASILNEKQIQEHIDELESARSEIGEITDRLQGILAIVGDAGDNQNIYVPLSILSEREEYAVMNPNPFQDLIDELRDHLQSEFYNEFPNEGDADLEESE